jgi:hypothetical protein
MSSRRGFLKAGILLGGASLAGGGTYYAKVLNTRVMAEQLVYFLEYPDLAREIGHGVMATDLALQFDSLSQVVNKILQNIGLSKAQLSEITRNDLLESLHLRVRADFMNETIVLVDGWLLSETEAFLCALYVIIT